VLTEARQAEIAAVVERLAAFRPTHIAVEWPSAEQASLDALYRDYREGRHELGRRELEQFGLRLAAKLGLGRVHAVDWRGLPPGDQQHYRWAAYGKANGHEARLSALADPKRV